MPLPSFDQWRESSPATRNKLAAAQGLQPLYSANVFGHSTPPPYVAQKLLTYVKKNKKPKDSGTLPIGCNEKVMKPNYEIDEFIRKAKKVRDQMDDDVEKGSKKGKELDDKKTKKQKEAAAKKPAPPAPKAAKKGAKAPPVNPPHFPFKSPTGNQVPDDDDEVDTRSDIEKQNEEHNWEYLL